jgi:hypothetical protein
MQDPPYVEEGRKQYRAESVRHFGHGPRPGGWLNHSKALTEFGGSWGFQDLFNYFLNPKAYVRSTSMSFAGLRKAKERANLAAFLQGLSPNAPPRLEPALAASAEAAPDLSQRLFLPGPIASMVASFRLFLAEILRLRV